jgi:hypothetical protein
MDLHKTNTRWLVHSWNTLGARTNHERLRTHKTHHGPDSGEATTFSYSILYSSPWRFHSNGFLSRDSQVGVPKLLRLELPQLCGTITFSADLRSGWSLKRSCSPHQEVSNGVSHVTWMQGNRVDSWLFVVGSQIASLTLNLSFGHKLCFRCPNGSCEPILDICVSIAFQWYK